MKPLFHFVTSSILAVVIFLITRSLSASLLVVLVGVFIDLDHLIDFWAMKPKNPFSVRDFLDCEKYNEQRKYIFIFAHAWEWVIALLVLGYLLAWPLLLTALTLTITLHLLLDIYNVITKAVPWWTYSFILRAIKGFRK